jgi:hypothetical protein
MCISHFFTVCRYAGPGVAYLIGYYDGIVFHAEITYRPQFFCGEDLPNGIIPDVRYLVRKAR